MNPSRIGLQRLAAAALLALAPIGAPLFAQTTATTDPVGFITLDIAGTGGTGTSKLSFKGLGLTRPVEYQGSAETAAGTIVTDSEASWSTDLYNPSGATVATATHYLEVISGPATGTTYDIVGTSTNTLTLGQPLAASVTAPVNFRVRKHWTIGSVFGPNNEAGLAGGTSNQADQIRIYNGSTYDTYYYSTGGFIGTGWRKLGSSPANANQAGAKLYPEDGILITRKQTSPINVVLTGAVKTGQTSIPVFGNGELNIISNPYAAPMTLGSSNLYTGNAATGIASGTSSSADEVRIYNGSTYDTYFYSNGGFIGNGWRKKGSVPANKDQATVEIPVGSSILITRKASGDFNWIAPQHPNSL